MKAYNPHIEDIPDHTAYHDGKRYYCDVRFCDGEPVECGLLYAGYMDVLPVLRCTECGTLYFGHMRKNYEQPKEEKSISRRSISDEEEHTAIILPNLLTV